MKKIIYTFIFGTLVILTLLTALLSFRGIETDKFNDFISKKIVETDNNVKIVN